MSTWRIGAEAAVEARAADRGTAFDMGGRAAEPPTGASGAIDRLTKWIPGDVLALYVAAVTAFAGGDGESSVPLLVVFIIVAFGFVLLAAFSVAGQIPQTAVLPAVLSGVAFTIWSLSVPLSGWQQLDFVADNQEAVAIIAALAALLFGLLAEGLTKRAAASAPAPPAVPTPPR